MRRRLLLLAVLSATWRVVHPGALSAQQVRVWEGTLELPSSVEGAPDPNPDFDYFRPTRITYPYTLRNQLTPEMRPRSWRALFIENEYLRCSVLPELGGHLYSCTDRTTGEELFYDNGAIKLTQIGYRGAWAAFGIEFNFPVSHNWMSMSPVDWALRSDEDGSARIQVGNVDRVYGSEWRVDLVLRPGVAVLEQHTLLSNRSDRRHRYYWWTNAAVRVTDESLVLYPMRRTASHGFTFVDTWPVDLRGTDNSRVGNHLFGPVSRFSHGSREDFMAVYHPDRRSGVVHLSPPTHLGPKKIWSWGGDERGQDWRRALSNDSSAYVEIQAGIFRNQETYGYLRPQESVTFSEFWTPLGPLGGLSRATRDAHVHLCRTDACGDLPAPGLQAGGTGPLRVRLGVTKAVPAADLTVLRGERTLWRTRDDLEPGAMLDVTIAEAEGPEPLRFTLRDANGRTLLDHTEGDYAFDPAPEDELGDQVGWTLPEEGARSEADYLLAADLLEREGRRSEAWDLYQAAADRYPGSRGILRARGLLAATLGRAEDAIAFLTPVVADVSNDAEAWYHLGLAHEQAGQLRDARWSWERALPDAAYRSSAHIRLGLLDARAGRDHAAVEQFRAALAAAPTSARAAGLLAAGLRRTDRRSEAVQVLEGALARRPSDSFLRWEAVQVGGQDTALVHHLAQEPDRLLELAADYVRAGWFEDADRVLSATDGTEATLPAEPGARTPLDHALLYYWRGWVGLQRGERPPLPWLMGHGPSSLAWVFAQRDVSHAILEDVLSRDATDPAALWLLGGIELQRLQPERAIQLWERAAELEPETPALLRSLGRLYLSMPGRSVEAVRALRRGAEHDAFNAQIYLDLDEALAAQEASASDRADALLAHPDLDVAPASLIYRAARRLAQAGRLDEADALFQDRFFPREEGGINVRQVYLEVRIARAEAAADEGACDEALQVLTRMMEPDPNLEFTRDGLSLWLERGGLEPSVRAVRSRCGRN